MLNGRFIYKSTPGGTFNKSNFICSICMALFHYQRINYHLQTKQRKNMKTTTGAGWRQNDNVSSFKYDIILYKKSCNY